MLEVSELSGEPADDPIVSSPVETELQAFETRCSDDLEDDDYLDDGDEDEDFDDDDLLDDDDDLFDDDD